MNHSSPFLPQRWPGMLLWLLLTAFLLLLGACTPPNPAALAPTAAPSTTLRACPECDERASPAPRATPSPSPTSTPIPPTPRSPTPTLALPPTPERAAAIALEPIIVVPNSLTYLTHADDDSQRLFLIEKTGRVLILSQGKVQDAPFLDITDRVQATSSEQGLLSIAFAPDYPRTGAFYANYTAQDGNGDTVISRFRVSADPNRADPASEQILLKIDQPAPNHNGGQLQFGPDGYLYIGTGDGGAAGDPWGNAQSLTSLLGKLLRIDVRNPGAYTIPPDNPFVGQTAAPEIWAYGLRNPWRFSFDPLTGDLYIADVGQNKWEEVDFQPADSAGGQNYGWNTLESRSCYKPASACDQSGKIAPATMYGHDSGCAITGGYVYRGARLPALAGIYIYGDYCSGRIWELRRDNEDEWRSDLLLDTDLNIASFGEDAEGEIYVVDLDGEVYRLTAP